VGDWFWYLLGKSLVELGCWITSGIYDNRDLPGYADEKNSYSRSKSKVAYDCADNTTVAAFSK
jgi:hypothetical protein